MKNISLITLLFSILLSFNMPSLGQDESLLKKSLPDAFKKYSTPLLGENVFLFESSMNMQEVQTFIDTLYNRQHIRESEFSPNRYALLFKPGTYQLNLKMGYYMHALGLGESPEDVIIQGGLTSKGFWNGNVTLNFWRSVENLAIAADQDTSIIWGVSQADPMRRVHIKGNLILHDKGWASGGFLADSKVDGTIYSGPQQQWFSRNVDMGAWNGGSWNMMFVGVPNAPADKWPDNPYTVIPETPEIREKPYLSYNKSGYVINVPGFKENSRGVSWLDTKEKKDVLLLRDFYIVKPGIDNSESINAQLIKGKNLLFTPGIYLLDKCLKVTRPGTMVLGLGFATLLPTRGNSVLEIADTDGVTISGLTMDAGKIQSETLLQVGEPNSGRRHQSNPTFLFDIFFRVGGYCECSTNSGLVINSNNVFVDHTWIWRADHGKAAGWDINKAKNGLIVNGDEVTIYGLFNEHFQEYQTLWNGNRGKVYFYQSEMPYDPPTVEAWKHDTIGGFASYKVSDNVTSHEAWGLGIYCVFYKAPVIVDNAIETPQALESNIHHKIIFWLNGNKESSMKSIINGKGGGVNKDVRKAIMK